MFSESVCRPIESHWIIGNLSFSIDGFVSVKTQSDSQDFYRFYLSFPLLMK